VTGATAAEIGAIAADTGAIDAPFPTKLETVGDTLPEKRLPLPIPALPVEPVEPVKADVRLDATDTGAVGLMPPSVRWLAVPSKVPPFELPLAIPPARALTGVPFKKPTGAFTDGEPAEPEVDPDDRELFDKTPTGPFKMGPMLAVTGARLTGAPIGATLIGALTGTEISGSSEPVPAVTITGLPIWGVFISTGKLPTLSPKISDGFTAIEPGVDD
jgi:hypothetical protein